MATSRWKHRPEGSTWGDFGPDDQIGRLNLITPEKVKQGAAEVREGRTFCLSLPLDYPGGAVLNPRRTPPVLSATGSEERPRYNMPLSVYNPLHTDVVCDDRVLLTLQYSTQWDSLCHVGAHFDADGDGKAEPLFYNGHRANVDVVGPIDYRTGEKTTEPIGARRLGVMDHDKVAVEKGDMLLLHTGFSQAILDMKRNPDGGKLGSSYAVLDGRDDALLQWITDSGIASLIADNYGVEAVPSRPGGPGPHAGLPLHQHCLFKLGVNLGEMFYLTELAAWLRQHKRSRFLLTAPPLRLPGAVGSPATPIATV
jgi:kynurenine formamidase